MIAESRARRHPYEPEDRRQTRPGSFLCIGFVRNGKRSTASVRARPRRSRLTWSGPRDWSGKARKRIQIRAELYLFIVLAGMQRVEV